jgi:hypothetical protein
LSWSLPLAHGIGGVKDLPVPLWLFFYGAAVVLVVSFVALGVLWRKPVLETHERGRVLPDWLQRVILGPELRFVLGAISVALLALTFATAAFGEDSVAVNFAPTFVWVVFWLGLVPITALFGNVWSVLSPWRAAADAVAWITARLGIDWHPPLRYPDRLGRWPAALLLLTFVSLELCYPDPARPRMLAIAIAIYSWITWLGMACVGREAWTQNGEAFASYFGFLARIAPFAVHDGKVVIRWPFVGLVQGDERHGTVAFLSIMLGSVAFDGFSRTTWWQDRLFDIESPFALERPTVADLATTAFNFLGLMVAIVAVALLYLAAVEFARHVSGSRRTLVWAFAGSLVPIAMAYAVAHYFSLFVLQGQVTKRLASDPFGYGWNLFGTADAQPNLTVLTPNTIWYVQVGALVIGHVLGLVVAHDRAVDLFHAPGVALRTQYAMLVLMVAYTVGGLWLLSQG